MCIDMKGFLFLFFIFINNIDFIIITFYNLTKKVICDCVYFINET